MIVETKLVLESLVVVIASVLGVPIVILVRQQEYNHALDVPMECLICPHGMPYLSQWNALSVPMECLICPNGMPYLSQWIVHYNWWRVLEKATSLSALLYPDLLLSNHLSVCYCKDVFWGIFDLKPLPKTLRVGPVSVLGSVCVCFN